MDVKHHLPRAGVIVLHDVDPVASRGGLDDPGQPRELLQHVRRDVLGHVDDARVPGRLGYEQTVSFNHGEGVEESQGVLGLEDLVARHGALDDLLEHVVVVVGNAGERHVDARGSRVVSCGMMC